VNVEATTEGHSMTYLALDDGGWIVGARILLHYSGDLPHEIGHAMGLSHSPRQRDLMYQTPEVREFSSDELAILGAMYPAGR
jgi:hypothetical protein